MSTLAESNEARWRIAKVDPEKQFSFKQTASRLVAAKTRYVVVQGRTSVPWFVIAVIHEREASQRWDRSLAQGDPWNAISTHVPKGRGPFASWEDAAFDALVNCNPFAARNRDWSPGGTLALLEKYNGLGYANKDLPSPYIWAGTDRYVKGKYIADGKFDPEHVDKQLGCAGLIKAMMALDPSIRFGGEAAPVPPPPDIDLDPFDKPTAPRNWLADLIAAILAIFKRKQP